MRPFGWTQCTAIVELMPYMPPLPSHKYQRGFSCLGTASCGMCRWSPNYFSVPSGYSSKKIIQNPKGESEFGALLKDRKGVWTLREAVSWYHIATCRMEPQNAHFLNKSSPSPVVKLMLKLTRGISIWRPILGGFSTPTHRLTKEGLKGIGSQMQMVYSGAQSAPSLGILLDFTWKSGSCLSGRNLNPYFIPAPPRSRTFFFLQGGVTLPSDRNEIILIQSEMKLPWNGVTKCWGSLSTSGLLCPPGVPAESLGYLLIPLPLSNSELQFLSHQH